MCRNKDRGATWQMPCFAPDFDWYGTECPGIAQLPDGAVALTQFRFGWYPLALARKRRAAGEPISLCLPEKGWTEDFDDQAWPQSRCSWARGYHGVYVHLSLDGGNLFEHTVKLDTGDFRDGYTRTPVKALSDGRLAYPLTEHHSPSNRFTYLVTSADYGRSWSKPTVVVDDEERLFGEPDIAETAPGELFCILRCGRRVVLHGCRSTDGGQTWSQPEATPLDGHPGHLLSLADGRLLCTFGRRKAPFGIRLALSTDGGRTWGPELIVRDDLPNGDLGYPTTLEYAPGALFVCYYGQHADGVTCVMGTYVEL